MPGMSGLELLPKARAARPDVPVIMITAYGDAETKRRALEGAEALLTKPIDFVMLRPAHRQRPGCALSCGTFDPRVDLAACLPTCAAKAAIAPGLPASSLANASR